jgi:hypothetical protein
MARWQAAGIERNRQRVDIEIAGDLAVLRQRLLATGWQVQPPADWEAALRLLDDGLAPAQRPVLPLALDAHPERLLLRRIDPADPRRIEVLRLWPAPARLENGASLWVVRFEVMQLRQRLHLLHLWKPDPPTHALPADLQRLGQDTDGALRVLLHAR